MRDPLHPALARFLRSVQHSTSVGVHGVCRNQQQPPRSVYRWQQSLGDQLLVIPNVTVEALGLRHAHVFITRPVKDTLSCPFAVEAAWVTPDFCQEILYLHCLVPEHTVPRFQTSAEVLGESVTVVWSESGWQEFLLADEPIQVPLRAGSVPATEALRHFPFIIPALLELWQFPNSLPVAWQRIRTRLGTELKTFLPRTKIRYVNGMTHVTQAMSLLRKDGLVRQQLIRYHPLLAVSVEVFVHMRLERDDVARMLDVLRSHLHGFETYPTSDGYWCRLLGPHRLLDAIINSPQRWRERWSTVYFHTKRHPAPLVRFAYETLFDPHSRSWKTA